MVARDNLLRWVFFLVQTRDTEWENQNYLHCTCGELGLQADGHVPADEQGGFFGQSGHT